MAILRRPRLLRCFYCNQRTTTAYDGSLRQFQCRSCDATNYLDENGDITDPPASTTAAATTTHYAAPPDPFHDGRGADDAQGDGRGTFCNTCLKNQHLFVASLAQYFPSDPNDPETPELERRYFAFRRGLEQRYPQICADCEPRVMARIRDADYTAKTDHLRRMVQYSRDVRRVTQTTPLDVAHRLGRWLWWTALVLQVLWQLGVVGSGLLPNSEGEAHETGFGDDAIVDDNGFDAPTADALLPAAAAAVVLPALLQSIIGILAAHTSRLQSLCVGATVAGCWWNPYLVETVRGFTKPLHGIPTWYAHQAALVVVRLLLSKVAVDTILSSTSALPPTVAGAHAVAAFFTLYLYARAPRSITKDMRPLFGKLPEVPTTPQKRRLGATSARPGPAEPQSEQNRRRGLETLSDVLDEIATTPAHGRRDSDTEGWDGWQPQPRQASRMMTTAAPLQPTASYDDADEMDWTPTTQTTTTTMQPSPHRAFNAFSASSVRPPTSSSSAAVAGINAFNQTPVAANKGPFWYKVPPAPTSIAQRMVVNRPNAPRIVQQQQQQQQAGRDGAGTTTPAGSPLFNRHRSSSSSTQALGFEPSPVGGGAATATSISSSVEFAQPSFFAEDLYRKGPNDDDPGSFLSDLFSQTFSLGQHDGEDEEVETEAADDDDDYNNDKSASGPATARARRRSSVHQRRQDAAARGRRRFVRRLLQLLATVASLAGVALLREGLDGEGPGGAASSTAKTTPAGSMDQLLLELVRPHARLVEAAAVGLCAVLAVSLAAESTTRRGRTRSVVGLVLGVASVVLAAWMAVQMAMQPSAAASSVASSVVESDASHADNYYNDDYGWSDDIIVDDGSSNNGELPHHQPGPAGLPWPWWQFATLHGALLVHQVWNVFVQ